MCCSPILEKTKKNKILLCIWHEFGLKTKVYKTFFQQPSTGSTKTCRYSMSRMFRKGVRLLTKFRDKYIGQTHIKVCSFKNIGTYPLRTA